MKTSDCCCKWGTDRYAPYKLSLEEKLIDSGIATRIQQVLYVVVCRLDLWRARVSTGYIWSAHQRRWPVNRNMDVAHWIRDGLCRCHFWWVAALMQAMFNADLDTQSLSLYQHIPRPAACIL